MRLFVLLILFSACCLSCGLGLDDKQEATSGFVHAGWLILLSGFSSSILFLIWKNFAGYQRISLLRLFGIIRNQIGDERQDMGILALSLAIMCWLVSGIVALFPDNRETLLISSACSSLNSCFLLLFLLHLDKEDLPAGFRAVFPSRQTIWTAFFIVVGMTLTLAVCGLPEFTILTPDFVFSLYTLVFIGLSFFYLLTARIKSLVISLLSTVPILVTLFAEVSRLLYVAQKDRGGAPDEMLVLVNQALLFAYKPLLIISYFLLIYSWQLKRINRKSPEMSGAPKSLTTSVVEANRAHYRMLGARDWIVLEMLARGANTTRIAEQYPQDFPNGAKGVDDRIGAIAREFDLKGQSQIKVVIAALKRGLLQLESIP